VFNLLKSVNDGVELTGGGGNDCAIYPIDIVGVDGIRCFSIADWITQMDYGFDSDMPKYVRGRLRPSHCCGGSPYLREWFMVTTESGKDQKVNSFQTWLSSQTWCVKFITSKLRYFWGLTDSALHEYRRRIVVEAGGTAIDSHQVNGFINVDGRKIMICISGHLVNLVLASGMFPIDFKRWFETVRMNVLSASSARKPRFIAEWKKLHRLGLLAEDGELDNEPTLHHGYYDFVLAFAAIKSMAREFGLYFNQEVVNYLQRVTGDLVIEFPSWRFDISQDAKQYLDETGVD